MWQKYITRRLAVQVAQAWNFGWDTAMRKVYGISLRNTLVFRDSQKTEYYVNQDEYARHVKGLSGLLNCEAFLRTFHHEAKAELEKILFKLRAKLRLKFVQLSNEEFLQVYQNDILPAVAQFYARMGTVFNLGLPLSEMITAKLRKKITDPTEFNQRLLVLFSPLEPNDAVNERLSLLTIASQKPKLKKSEFEKRVRNHTKNYRHIPMFDFDHQPYTEASFIKELRKIEYPSNELADLRLMFKNRRLKFNQMVRSLKPDKKFKLLLEFLKENIFLRDYRDMIRQKLNLELRKFYVEAGKRLGLSLAQVATLTNEEIIKSLGENKKFSPAEAKRREQAFLLIQKSSAVEIYSGQKAVARFKKECKPYQPKVLEKIRGSLAAPGRARGPVKIVRTNQDLNKIKDGDIMVTGMTRQDFVPALRRVSALVTDEGGMICHAAIIAREFKIPCVVGAKIATLALSDGDLVDVDADRGIIRKVTKHKGPLRSKKS